MRMMREPFFARKQILVVDKAPKKNNDRTWCFWETGEGFFENIVHHKWQQIDFYSQPFSARFDLQPYQYKMIRAADFYQYAHQHAALHNNIHFYYDDIISVGNEAGKAVVVTSKNRFTANYVFNTVLFDNAHLLTRNALLQHFKGWLIEADANIFEEHIATFMDFRVPQNEGATFVYVLPVSPTKALVEYTLFSKKLLQQNEYDNALRNYIATFLKPCTYSIVEEEFGVIPMTDHVFSAGEKAVVNIGTAGGQTKASSGFTFQFIQKQTEAIVQALVNNKTPFVGSLAGKRFKLYDDTLLHILANKKMGADVIFAMLFKKNPVQRVLRFLDNETTIAEEMQIMNSVPAKVFLPSALRQIFKFKR